MEDKGRKVSDAIEGSEVASDVGASPGHSCTRLRASESALLGSSVGTDASQASELTDSEDLALSLPTSSATLLPVEIIIEDKVTQLHADASKLANDPERAILLLNKAVSLRPSVAQYYVARAEMFIQLCDFRSSILNLKRAQTLDRRNLDIHGRLAFVYYFYGQILFDQHLYTDALTLFQTAARMKPESISYNVRSITCLAALGRHGSCLDLVNKRLRLNEENPDLYVMRAKLQQMFGNITQAYFDISCALKIDSHHCEAKSMLTVFVEKAEELRDSAVQESLLGNMKESIQKITSAIETNPSKASYHTLRGAIHRRQGNFEAAIDDFLVALDKCGEVEGMKVDLLTSREASRQLVLTYNDFAVECFTKQYYNEAVVLLNKAIKAEKEEKGLFINRGDCFYCMRELHFSLSDYLQALELDPNDVDVRSRMSVIHCELGVDEFENKHFEKAAEHFSTSIDNNPQISRYYVCRAHARYLMNEMVEAQEDIVLALLLEPGNEEAGLLFQRLFPGQTLDRVVRKGLTNIERYKQILTKTQQPGRLNTHSVPALSDDGKVTAAVQDLVTSLSFKLDSHSSHSLLSITDGSQSQVVASMTTVSKPNVDDGNGNDMQQKLAIVPLPVNVMPDLRACMKESEFHAEIYYSKKRMDKMVQHLLYKREKLDYSGPKITSRLPIS
ncbi:tetratricopeptide repeat protein 16-like [Corticium candelabrum]|uniref:tetratricopeptide repeat protein 16-like n=1 Tax=Corticium candelabrum TaxID=121492 RepID=UPI002E25DC98|nr:tetratricopeptide repeat protein 16-like [Corticium candelabrum]